MLTYISSRDTLTEGLISALLSRFNFHFILFFLLSLFHEISKFLKDFGNIRSTEKIIKLNSGNQIKNLKRRENFKSLKFESIKKLHFWNFSGYKKNPGQNETTMVHFTPSVFSIYQ